jgi:hypothetical protein
MTKPVTPSWSASLLRRDLNARAHHLARTQSLLHDISPGSKSENDPAVIFGHDEQGKHGNFHPDSYANICANPAWLRRLTKPHTASRRSRPRKDWQWRELDTAASSDALLMNIFCHPAVFNGQTLAPAVANRLGVDPATTPCFGLAPGVPLKTLRKTRKPGSASTGETLTDRTEIDLQLDNLFLEAKLTESSFQTAPLRLIERYRDLETVFDLDRLPRKTLASPATHPPVEDYSQLEDEHRIEAVDVVILSAAKNPCISPKPPRTLIETAAAIATQATRNTSSDRTLIQGYQLIRNVLAAYAAGASFCVLSDARRHDLIETWYSILSAVHSPTFATRLKLLTWQELSTTLPQDLQLFLEAKYGILPARR